MFRWEGVTVNHYSKAHGYGVELVIYDLRVMTKFNEVAGL